MKKAKTILLLVSSVVLLASCRGRSGGGSLTARGKLPSGGVEIDLTTESGMEKLKDAATHTISAYADLNLDSVGLDLILENTSYEAEAKNINYQNMFKSPASASIKLSNLGAKVSLKAAKSSTGGIDASVGLNDVKGKIDVNASLPGPISSDGTFGPNASISSSLDISGANANVYFCEPNVYVDLSGLDGTVLKTETFLNKILVGLKQTCLADVISGTAFDEQGRLPLVSYYNEAIPNKRFYSYSGNSEWPDFSQYAANVSEIDFSQLSALLVQYKISTKFIIYEEGTFGLQFNMSKGTLELLLNSALGTNATLSHILAVVNDSINKYDVSAAFYFKDYLLTSAGFGLDYDANVKNIGDFASSDVGITGSLSVKAACTISTKISYGGVKVSFPDFSNYVEK